MMIVPSLEWPVGCNAIIKFNIHQKLYHIVCFFSNILMKQACKTGCVFHLKVDTVRSKWNHSEAILWSKMLIFKRVFHKLIVLPHLCPPQKFWPLIRAFKWYTIQGFSSRGIRMDKQQIFRLLTLLNKRWVFCNF